MPGPVSRADLASIDKHLLALAPFGDETLALHRRLGRATRGAIDAPLALRFQALLEPPRASDDEPRGH